MAQNKIAVLGVVQEQHAARTRLYKQWRGFDFPIVQDPITKIGARAVPMFIAIDQHGIVRHTRLNPADIESQFLDVMYAEEAPPANNNRQADDVDAQPATDRSSGLASLTVADQNQDDLARLVAQDPSPLNLVNLADHLLLNCLAKLHAAAGSKHAELPSDAASLSEPQKTKMLPDAASLLAGALQHYQLAYEKQTDPMIAFRLGVAYRLRFDEMKESSSDFRRAAECWSAALSGDVNQYIWRRRIEQYGPRMAKPYAFYDWVEQAQQEIIARGEVPFALDVELTDSELSKPARNLPAEVAENPDPQAKVNPVGPLAMRVQWVAVPAALEVGKSNRLHLNFQMLQGKWNHESQPLQVWIEPIEGIRWQENLLSPKPMKNVVATSQEPQTVEFDCLVDTLPPSTKTVKIKGFALFNRCEDVSGICLYQRFDFEMELPLAQAKQE